jgi:hypothetical protein
LREERRLKFFVSRELRRIFWSKRDEIKWQWRKLHREELSDPNISPNILWVIKQRRKNWEGHVH